MKSVLMLVDLQGDYLSTPQLQPPAEVLIHRVAELLQAFRRRQLAVIHVWTTVHRELDDRLPHWRAENRWMCVAGTSGHEPPRALRPLVGEAIVHKQGFNAFTDGKLEPILREIQCDQVTLAGLHLHACVRTAAVECLERHWPVCIVDDAVASNDPIHAAATRRWLEQRGVTFEPVRARVRFLENWHLGNPDLDWSDEPSRSRREEAPSGTPKAGPPSTGEMVRGFQPRGRMGVGERARPRAHPSAPRDRSGAPASCPDPPPRAQRVAAQGTATAPEGGCDSPLPERFLESSTRSLIHHSPHTGEILFEVPVEGRKEVDAIAHRTLAGWEEWRHTEFSHRRQILEHLASCLESAAIELAHQMAVEIGKPVTHGLEEVRRAAANVRDVIRRAALYPSFTREAAGLVRHRPVGVVGVITAWNNPVAIPIGKIAPALAYGNAVIWKPAPSGSRIAQKLLQLVRRCGVPDEVIGLLTGDHSTAQSIAENPIINAVTLTGSVLAGYAVQEICARRMVPLQAELSGNNAAIVWDDADLAEAAAQVASGAFAFAGQRCTANRRVIVPATRFNVLLSALEIATARLPLGDPLNNSTEIGPLINTAARDEHLFRINDAESNGDAHRVVRLHTECTNQLWAAGGAYTPPVILGCDQPEHGLVQEETMSPLLVIQRAEDFEHALALCDGVRHGLIASLFSDSTELQRRFLDQISAGVLKLNRSTAGVDATLPFGGWKASGLGPPEHGEGDPLFYTRMQAVYGDS